MKKRAVVIGVLLAFGLFVWFSPLPYIIRGYWNHEPFYGGMPASLWGKRLSCDIPPLPPVAEKVLPPTPLTRTAMGTLAEGGRSAIPVVVELLKHENEHTRFWAVYALCLMGPEAEEAIPQVLELLHSEPPENWSTLGCAARFLADRGPKAQAAIPALCELSRNPNSFLRWDIAQVLGKIDHESHAAVLALTELLDDSDPVVRGSAAESLGQMGSAAKEAIPALIRHLDDDSSEAEVYVAEALWRLTGKADSILSVLIRIVEEGEAKEQAIRVLALLGKEAAPAIPALRQALNDRYEFVRKSAATLLRQLEPDFKVDLTPANP